MNLTDFHLKVSVAERKGTHVVGLLGVDGEGRLAGGHHGLRTVEHGRVALEVLERTLSSPAYEAALSKVLVKEEVALRGLNEVRLQALALKLNDNIGDGIVVLDEPSPATSSSLNVLIIADAPPTDTEMEGEVIDDGMVVHLRDGSR